MLTTKQMETRLAKSPAPRVTKEYMESRIKSRQFTRFTETVTICQLTLDNGYSVRDESACVNAANYDQGIGEKVSYDKAFAKLWPLFGFMLAEHQYFAPEAKNVPLQLDVEAA